jgi:hypothetical protein
MKTTLVTLAVLATSTATAVTLYLAKKKRNQGTGVLKGTFHRVREAAHYGS